MGGVEQHLFRALLSSMLFVWVFLSAGVVATPCNKAVCGSIVSKCMLTDSCNCEAGDNCPCCRECYLCLSHLFAECCSCLDMCPERNVSVSDERRSHSEDLDTSNPEVFDLFTELPDTRWSVESIQVNIVPSQMLSSNVSQEWFKKHYQVTDEEILNTLQETTCRLAYLSECYSWEKCHAACRSLFAAKYTWFANACCACAGATCPDSVMKDNRCASCPGVEEGEYLEEEINLEFIDSEQPVPDDEDGDEKLRKTTEKTSSSSSDIEEEETI